ncbi:gamma-glutamylcyclotransferase [Dokdonella sp.]|nr:gamma-glutamylcyclotransferase [Xanthomonadales bacterium]
MLRQIASSKGPSGLNRDYFAHLADALRALGESDSHIDRIEQELMTLPAE